MNGAVFLLAVNFVIAISFSAVFAVVSTRSRSRTGALWIAAGFAVASLSALCEILVAYTDLPRLWAIGAFATVLGGMILLRIGIGELYGMRIRQSVAVLFFLASVIVDILIYNVPRGTVLHAFAYQTPFALVVMASAVAVFASRRRLLIDRALGVLLVFTSLHFFAKAGFSVLVGSGVAAKDYVGTNYALVSQSSTAVLIVAVGLTLLSVLVLEIMADERSNSEKDGLSGLSNRRGFENGVATAISHAPHASHAFILCDLDYFKTINDTYGHHAGDLVIQAFGNLLRANAPVNSVVGRIGGEEFAIFVPAASVESAHDFAEGLRRGIEALAIGGLPVSVRATASFGVAEFSPGQRLEDVMREADTALYAAKRAGRNCVREAPRSLFSRYGEKPNITRIK